MANSILERRRCFDPYGSVDSRDGKSNCPRQSACWPVNEFLLEDTGSILTIEEFLAYLRTEVAWAQVNVYLVAKLEIIASQSRQSIKQDAISITIQRYT